MMRGATMDLLAAGLGYKRQRIGLAFIALKLVAIETAASRSLRQSATVTRTSYRPRPGPRSEDQRTVRSVTRLDAPVTAFVGRCRRARRLASSRPRETATAPHALRRPGKSRARRASQLQLARKRYALGVGSRFRHLRKLSPAVRFRLARRLLPRHRG